MGVIKQAAFATIDREGGFFLDGDSIPCYPTQTQKRVWMGHPQ